MDADGERLEKDVESGAKSGQPEGDENENQEPDDAPENVASITTSSAVTFASHIILISFKNPVRTQKIEKNKDLTMLYRRLF